MLKRKIFGAFLLYALLLPSVSFAQTSRATAPTAKVYTAPTADIDKIRDEGMNHSKVMETISYLTDVIGPRLTNSPGMKRANEWTRDTMAKWGLTNAKLESWGPFGRGWSLVSFTAAVVEPQTIAVIAYPKAWSPSTKGEIIADVVFFDATTEADLQKYKGKLRGKIVLTSFPRELKAEDQPLANRRTQDELKQMADETSPNGSPRQTAPRTAEDQERAIELRRFFLKKMNFLLEESPAVTVDNSFRGSGGTLFVQGATVIEPIDAVETRSSLRAHQKEAEARMLPQMTMATEDYNRLVRMIKQGVTPRMKVNIKGQYHDDDPMGYNTVAEIPGTDPQLKDEIVMVGAHLDSWHASTGATDNAAGSAVAMEAARIIIASGLKPRRTIRVALWSGEEQGLYGSREYVKQHFGAMSGERRFGPPDPNAPKPTLTKTGNYDKLSAYYNLDNGTGRIRGVYMQGNALVKPYFEAWLAPFADTGAATLTILNTRGTDHQSFDAIGLPGFQFIQDEVEYNTRTHHSNQDNYDRIQADDMKQAATIIASFAYQTAMMDEKLPRKPME